MRGTEFIAAKRRRNRKKKRYLKNRRRDHLTFEVRTTKRQKFVSERTDVFIAKEKLARSTMEADAFWKNYTAAHEWQKRHSITWWRSRCFALEYENQILREKIKSLAQQSNQQTATTNYEVEPQEDIDCKIENSNEEVESNSENENLEFHVNEDMMSFLEQSIRHKMELKQKRESELAAAHEEQNAEILEGGAAWVRMRNNNAKLLYGEASPRILAMETALQAMVDRYRDKAKPQYWPNIALQP